MKIEKTSQGYIVVFPPMYNEINVLPPSDYLQLREHFAKEIVEGLTDEMIDKVFKMFAGENSPEFDEAAKKGAKWFRDFITGNK